MTALEPWVVPPGREFQANVRAEAIDRGLYMHGYGYGKGEWPRWAKLVFYAVATEDEVAAVRAVAEGGESTRDAVLAAHALGGRCAVRSVVDALLGRGPA